MMKAAAFMWLTVSSAVRVMIGDNSEVDLG